jgi:hypothetical protein
MVVACESCLKQSKEEEKEEEGEVLLASKDKRQVSNG